MPGIDLSIIIVSFNTKDYLRDCLHSIYQSTGMENCEVMVVDNCSADGSPEMVASTFPQVILIKPGENLGFARANNLGAKSAHGRYLLFLNPDTVVFPDTFSKMIEFMDAKPDAGAANCLVLNEDGSVQLLANRRKPSVPVIFLESLSLNRRFPNNPINHKYTMADWDRSNSRSVDVISGAFFMVRTEIFISLKGFDEQYFMYVEDFELCSRIQDIGYGIWFNPNTNIIHFGGKSSQYYNSLSTTKGIHAFYVFLHLHYSFMISSLFILTLSFAFFLRLCFYYASSIVSERRDVYSKLHSTIILLSYTVKLRV